MTNANKWFYLELTSLLILLSLMISYTAFNIQDTFKEAELNNKTYFIGCENLACEKQLVNE